MIRFTYFGSTTGFYTWDGYLLEYNTNTKSSIHDISKVSSTTGNITGVYDMSGGTSENVMGYYSPASSTWGANSDSNTAGFTSQPNSKYYDDYAGFVYDRFPWFLRDGGYNNTYYNVGIFNFKGIHGGNAIGLATRSVLLLNSN